MIDVVELFAGVGGFRLGLEGYKKADSIFYSCLSNYSAEIEQANYFNTILSNQFEPGSKSQLASKVYRKRFGDIGHYNVDINNLSADDILYCQENIRINIRLFYNALHVCIVVGSGLIFMG